MQIESDEEEEQSKNTITNDEFEQLLEGIDFDEIMECPTPHPPVVGQYEDEQKSISNTAFQELLEGIDFDDEMTDCTQAKVTQENTTPILLPFTSNEPKSPMSDTDSSPYYETQVSDKSIFKKLSNIEMQIKLKLKLKKSRIKLIFLSLRMKLPALIWVVKTYSM